MKKSQKKGMVKKALKGDLKQSSSARDFAAMSPPFGRKGGGKAKSARERRLAKVAM